VLAIAGVAAVAVALLAVPLAIVLQRNYSDEDLLRLQRDTVADTRQIDLGARGSDPVELPRGTGSTLGAYDRAGRRVAGVGPLDGDAVVRSALRTGRPADRTGGGHLVVAVPLLTGERVSGAVRAERDDAGAARDTRDAWVLLAAIAAGILALAVLAAVLIARRLARPLERLAGAAGRLGEGDFSVRAPRAGIAEVDAVGEALGATAGRLDDLVARERAFSADASHQLRTPIAALRLELEAIELRGGSSAELAAALAQVDRLEATVATLLALARDAPRSSATTDLATLLEGVESRWRGPLAADGRPLRTVVRAGEPVARVSPRVATEILDVLLDNARHHGAGAVTVTVRDLEGWLAVDVADEGTGFGGDAEAAFTRRTGTGNGHGIGLSLARSLAHAEGARLAVGQPGPGPVVTLLVPR
jgi:signal transduction histidine kinase